MTLLQARQVNLDQSADIFDRVGKRERERERERERDLQAEYGIQEVGAR